MPDPSFYLRSSDAIFRRGAGGIVARVDDDRVVVGLVKEVEVGDAHYVLPKGGVDPDEDLRAAARREIHEETGLSAVTHLHHFGTFGRVSFNRRYWQETDYGLYASEEVSGEILDKENHYDFGWFPIDALPPMYWSDERRLVESMGGVIEQKVREYFGP